MKTGSTRAHVASADKYTFLRISYKSVIFFYQFSSDRPRFPVSNRSLVNLYDWHYFSCSSSEEHFVCKEEIHWGNLLLNNCVPQLLSDLHRSGSCYTPQGTCRSGWRQNRSVRNNEYVFCDTFTYKTFLVQADRFIDVCTVCFDLRKYTVQIV